MKKNYYFLSIALPELEIDQEPEITFEDLGFLLKVNLTDDDFEKTKVLRNLYDMENIRYFWLEQDIDSHGFYNRNDLEEALLSRMGLKEYVYDFLTEFKNRDERLKNFSSLIVRYFAEEIDKAEGFLKKYLIFEREWRLTIAGFRAKIAKKDIAIDLQFEDPYDDLVAQILAQKDAKRYEPPTDYKNLKIIFEQNLNDPLKLNATLCKWRFQTINNMVKTEPFTIDFILAYMAKLIIVEEWMTLDQKRGLKVVDEIIGEAS